MIVKCRKCGEIYDVDFNLIERKVQCVCGFKWILREEIPEITPARSLNEELEAITIDDIVQSPEKALQKMHDAVSRQYHDYATIASLEESLDDTYEKMKLHCAYGNPVPGVFKEFFKICRKKNIADKKAKKFQTVVDRINMMIQLDKKMCKIKWLSCAKHNGIPLRYIEEHYCAITITDRKNLAKCKELLKHK